MTLGFELVNYCLFAVAVSTENVFIKHKVH